MRVRDLKAFAQSLDDAKFIRQLGPYVLIQRPPREVVRDRMTDLARQITAPSRRDRTTESAFAIIHEFQDLFVADIPPANDKGQIVIGRQADCDLVIDDESVSKRHASIRWDDKKHRSVLKDLGSSNGTYVDENRIRGELPLSEPAVLSFGDVDFWYMPTEGLHWRLLHWATPGA